MNVLFGHKEKPEKEPKKELAKETEHKTKTLQFGGQDFQVICGKRHSLALTSRCHLAFSVYKVSNRVSTESPGTTDESRKCTKKTRQYRCSAT